MNVSTLSAEALQRALNLRDLSDPQQGPHSMQSLVDDILTALQKMWCCKISVYRESPIVSIEDNYDKLRYPADGASRDARYTRYVSETTLLRTMTSAMVPKAMRAVAENLPDDVLLVCPGLVYRRDCIDRLHTGEPHQLDLWRLCRSKEIGDVDMREMIGIVVQTALPGMEWKIEPRVHPYTHNGLQIDVLWNGEWIEIAECGLAHPGIICENIPAIDGVTGLAMGLGIDRLIMVRKGIKDIRLLRSQDPRVASQMLDLEPYKEVSSMPPVVRDISLVLDEDDTVEEIGDRVREALGEDADVAETVKILSQTSYTSLPPAAIERLGIRDGQKNILLRVVLRALERTLTHVECNAYRDKIYQVLHRGSSWQWAVSKPVDG